MTVEALLSPVRRDLTTAVAVASSAGAGVGDLAEHLYAHWYLGHPVDEPPEVRAARTPAGENLLDALRAADASSGRWEEGWTVAAVSSKGRVGVVRDGRRRVLHRVDVLPVAGPCLPPEPGAAVRVTGRRDHGEPDGFWFTFGGDWDETARPTGVVRYYWNAPAAALPALVAALTSALQEAGANYGFKAASIPALAVRPDSAVLYLQGADTGALRPALMEVYREVGGLLDEPTPPLALPLGPGLAVAEDPETEESFGQHRCRLLAEGLTASMTLDGAVSGLLAGGIDPQRPHLNRGGTEDHSWPAA